MTKRKGCTLRVDNVKQINKMTTEILEKNKEIVRRFN